MTQYDISGVDYETLKNPWNFNRSSLWKTFRWGKMLSEQCVKLESKWTSIDPLGNEPIVLVTFPIPKWRRERHGNHMLLLVTELESALSVFRQREKTSMRSISWHDIWVWHFRRRIESTMGLSALEIRCELRVVLPWWYDSILNETRLE